MCGIAGIIAVDELRSELEAALRSMQAALRHRGPDDEGIWMSEGGGARAVALAPRLCGLAHTRLSILDLSPAGHQPMRTPDGRFTIVFNGEIYNFRALREELCAGGVAFQSQSDTEVILRLYERDGAACVRRLRGMFAFALWDAREQTCLLARDPLGIKPLYFAAIGGRLIFASELRAVLASGLVEKRLDPVSVLGYFETGSVPEPGTLVRHVEMLPAGSTLLWKDGAAKKDVWWQLDFHRSGPREEQSSNGHGGQYQGVVREALLDSIRHHFVSDVPVGVFLSGGIDSTAIVALSRAAGLEDLRTFSISFDDPRFNEGELSRRTAEHFGTQHADLRLDSTTGRDLFDDFLTKFDQPSIDGLNTFAVSKFARDRGMKVVLSGLGGDELFGGYPTFSRVPGMMRWSRALGLVPGARRSAARLLSGSEQPRLRRLGRFFDQAPTMQSAYRTYRGVFPLCDARKLAAGWCGARPEEMDESWPELLPQPTPADDVSAMELQLYMRNQLLRDSDVMSMACGLELRVPLVDRCLVEALARVPASVRLRAGKRLLIEAVPEVPEWVWNRPKRGFMFPFETWLGGDWREVFEGSANRNGVRADTWYQKWSLFVFEHWCERKGVPSNTDLRRPTLASR